VRKLSGLRKLAGLGALLPDVGEFAAHVLSRAKGNPAAAWQQAKHELHPLGQTADDIRGAVQGVQQHGVGGALKHFGKGVAETFKQPFQAGYSPLKGEHMLPTLAYGYSVPYAAYQAKQRFDDPNKGMGEKILGTAGEMAGIAGAYHPRIGFGTAGALALGGEHAGAALGRGVDRMFANKTAAEAVFRVMVKEALARGIQRLSDQQAEAAGGPDRKVLEHLVATPEAKRDAANSYERGATEDATGHASYLEAHRKGAIDTPGVTPSTEKNVHTHPYLGNLDGARQRVKERVALRLQQIRQDVTQAVQPSPADATQWQKMDQRAGHPVAHTVVAPQFGLEGIHRFDHGRMNTVVTDRPARVMKGEA
jgi:hypothetical protein